MFRPAILALTCLALAASAAACSDDSNTPEATPTPTFQSVEPEILSAFVLAPEDVAPLPGIGYAYSPPAAGVVSFYTSYGDSGLRLQSTVGAFGDVASREVYITDMRRALATAIGNERNLNLKGIDRGFVYTYLEGTPSTAALAVTGAHYILVQMISEDGSRESEVFDQALLSSYVQTSLDRIQQYEDDPSSVKRPDWAPLYTSPSPAAPAPTPTPAP